VAELILMKILKRAKELIEKEEFLFSSQPLLFFLQNKITMQSFTSENLNLFSQLDDFDIISALKSWQYHDDFILSSLSKMIINRDLLKIKISNLKPSVEELNQLKLRFISDTSMSITDANYFVFKGKIKNQAYSKEAESIRILKKDKSIADVVEVSDQLNLKSLSKFVTKYYTCFPKQLV
jgi:hypothetical protein